MIFKQHFELKDRHAFLSASKSAWLRYTPDRLLEAYANADAAALGTRLHAWAHETIALRRKQPNTGQTLNSYINDCIGYRMTNEQPLVYSEIAFGTADAIDLSLEFEAGPTLRIFDLKTGVKPTSEDQLLIYAALFCLEYKFKPYELVFDLRIYQNDSIKRIDVTAEDIQQVMDRVIESDKIIRESMRERGV